MIDPLKWKCRGKKSTVHGKESLRKTGFKIIKLEN
jgi:hypothetical protein